MRYLAAILLVSSLQAHAQMSAATSGFKNPKDTKGLCTTDNKEESYFKEGTCQSLKEALAEDKCTAPLLEKLRQKLLKPPVDPKQQFQEPDLKCSSRGKQTDWPEIIKNKQIFGSVMMQFFMAVAIAESNLDTFYNLEKGAGANINADKKGGVMNLTLTQMDAPKYNKDGCGCHVTNSEQVAWNFWYLLLGENAYAANTAGQVMWTGRSPGPRDTHHSVQCGAYMALVEAAEDGVLFQGKKQATGTAGAPAPPNDDKPKGAAKIFASLQNWEEPPNNRPPASSNPDDLPLANNPNLDFVKKKVRSYCRKNLNENGGMVRTFDQDFPGGGTAIR